MAELEASRHGALEGVDTRGTREQPAVAWALAGLLPLRPNRSPLHRLPTNGVLLLARAPVHSSIPVMLLLLMLLMLLDAAGLLAMLTAAAESGRRGMQRCASVRDGTQARSRSRRRSRDGVFVGGDP
jgi:hypothetical protein